MSDKSNHPVSMSKVKRRCWEHYPPDTMPLEERIDEPKATCMLPNDHDGDHEFTPDTAILVTMASYVDGEE